MQKRNDVGSGEQFGSVAFSESDSQRIADLLERKLAQSDLATRAGPGNAQLTYLESHKAFELANAIFEYNGWSSKVVDITADFCDQDSAGKFNVGVSAIIRITLKDGCYHEDVGYGIAKMPDKGAALEKAKKEAITDANKRALRLFGSALGNCVYDKKYVSAVAKGYGASEPVLPSDRKRKRDASAASTAATPTASTATTTAAVSTAPPSASTIPRPPLATNSAAPATAASSMPSAAASYMRTPPPPPHPPVMISAPNQYTPPPAVATPTARALATPALSTAAYALKSSPPRPPARSGATVTSPPPAAVTASAPSGSTRGAAVAASVSISAGGKSSALPRVVLPPNGSLIKASSNSTSAPPTNTGNNKPANAKPYSPPTLHSAAFVPPQMPAIATATAAIDIAGANSNSNSNADANPPASLSSEYASDDLLQFLEAVEAPASKRLRSDSVNSTATAVAPGVV